MSINVRNLLTFAADLTDKDIEVLSERIDNELAGGIDPAGTLRALRELGQGNTGKAPADPLA